VVPVSAQSFERTTHNEATDSASLTAGAQGRECSWPYALGEVPVKVLSDGGSTPPISTKPNRQVSCDACRFFCIYADAVSDANCDFAQFRNFCLV